MTEEGADRNRSVPSSVGRRMNAIGVVAAVYHAPAGLPLILASVIDN
jgi:hypothetical protein